MSGILALDAVMHHQAPRMARRFPIRLPCGRVRPLVAERDLGLALAEGMACELVNLGDGTVYVFRVLHGDAPA